MAKIVVEGFVDSWSKAGDQHPAWGLKLVEPHRRKVDGEWQTVGRTFRTVQAGWDNGIKTEIDFTQFKKDDRVRVIGEEVTKSREYNGKKYYDLVVNATSVEKLTQGAPRHQVDAPVGFNNALEFVDDGSAPF